MPAQVAIQNLSARAFSFGSNGLKLMESSQVDDKPGRGHGIAIRAGLSDKGFFYSSDLLRASVKLFENVRLFKNHPTFSEEFERPERDFDDKLGITTAASFDEVEQGIDIKFDIFDIEFAKKARSMVESGHANELQLSINAQALVSDAETPDGVVLNVEEFLAIRSIDFVTEAGAGGEVILFESARPSRLEDNKMKDDEKKVLEKRIEDLEESISKLEKAAETGEKLQEATAGERDVLKNQIALGETSKAVETALTEAKLPEDVAEIVRVRFQGKDSTDGIDTAVSEMKLIVESSRKGLKADSKEDEGTETVVGVTESVDKTEKTSAKIVSIQEAMKQRFIAQGKTKEVAERMAANFA